MVHDVQQGTVELGGNDEREPVHSGELEHNGGPVHNVVLGGNDERELVGKPGLAGSKSVLEQHRCCSSSQAPEHSHHSLRQPELSRCCTRQLALGRSRHSWIQQEQLRSSLKQVLHRSRQSSNRLKLVLHNLAGSS